MIGPRRKLTSMEFLAPEGVRIVMDREGWRIVTPRNLGEKTLQRARVLLEKLENCQPPEDPERLDPFTLEDIGLHVAKTFTLRITHRYFVKR